MSASYLILDDSFVTDGDILIKSKNYIDFIKKTDEPIALVLGRYITSDLGAVRNLDRKNIPTIVLSPYVKQISSFSRYYKGITCPHPKYDEKKYVDFLLDIGKNLNNKGVLLPNGDAEVLITLKNKSNLEKYYEFSSADFGIVEKLVNKRIFYETINKHGILCPKTYFLNDESDIKKTCKKISYPCIVKPVHSDYFVSDFRTKLFVAKSEVDLMKKYKIATAKKHKVMIQEIIPGEVKNHYGFNAYYDRNLKLNGSFMYRRIREWPHDFGNGCLIESVKIPELEKIVTDLVKKIGYYGIVDAEFKKDSRDNKFKLLEINPRCWMQNSLPARCGINYSYMAYMDAIGKNFEKQEFNGKHVKWLFMLEDLQSSLKSMLKGDLSFQEWVNSFKGEKEYTIFAWDDPIPFFVLFSKSVYLALPYLLKWASPYSYGKI